jgi:mRNA-degrading endonuclease toxin of MazEF toxin-antitoxin module
MNRGDVILVRFLHPSGLRGKKRPAVIVQSDAYAGAVGTLVVAEVTKNLTMAKRIPPAGSWIRTRPKERLLALSAIRSCPVWCL